MQQDKDLRPSDKHKIEKNEVLLENGMDKLNPLNSMEIFDLQKYTLPPDLLMQLRRNADSNLSLMERLGQPPPPRLNLSHDADPFVSSIN